MPDTKDKSPSNFNHKNLLSQSSNDNLLKKDYGYDSNNSNDNNNYNKGNYGLNNHELKNLD